MNLNQIPQIESIPYQSSNTYRLSDDERNQILAENERRGLAHLVEYRNQCADHLPSHARSVGTKLRDVR